MNKTCELIKRLRKESGLKASQFAEIMGVNKSSVSKWENNEIPSADHLYKIARHFQVTVDELLRGQLKTENLFNSDAYDLSSFDIPKLIEKKNKEELLLYFDECNAIKKRYFEFLPKAAYQGLEGIELEEFRYIKKYFSHYHGIKYDIDYQSIMSGGLDKNEMKAVKAFYERIKSLSKTEMIWELERTFVFAPKLYESDISKLDFEEVFESMIKVEPQINKNELLNSIVYSFRDPIQIIRNKYVYILLTNGAKILKRDIWHAHNWDEELIKAYDGEIKYFERKNGVSYLDSDYYLKNGDCSFKEYVGLIDEKKTTLLREAVILRKTKPKEYYLKLKSGQYDYLLNY